MSYLYLKPCDNVYLECGRRTNFLTSIPLKDTIFESRHLPTLTVSDIVPCDLDWEACSGIRGGFLALGLKQHRDSSDSDTRHKSLGWDLATREPVGPQSGSGVQGTGLLGTADKCVVCKVPNDMFIQSQIIITIN